MKIYVASSWRNLHQPEVVAFLRNLGDDVYDFRNPKRGDNGFHWSEIDPNWEDWSPSQYAKALKHPIATAGFESDLSAMEWADTCILVLPCGRSAHLEAGWFCGVSKPSAVLILDQSEPELMYLLGCEVLTSYSDLRHWCNKVSGEFAGAEAGLGDAVVDSLDRAVEIEAEAGQCWVSDHSVTDIGEFSLYTKTAKQAKMATRWHELQINSLRDVQEQIDDLTKERDEAWEMLRGIVGMFQFPGHPGYPALQTGWVNVKKVEEWRAYLAAAEEIRVLKDP